MQLLLYLHLNLSFCYVLLKCIHHFYVIFSSSFLLSVGFIEYVSLLYIFPPIHFEMYTLFYSFSGNIRDRSTDKLCLLEMASNDFFLRFLLKNNK